MFWRRKRQLEAELDAELQDHIARQIADYLAAGMTPVEARRRVRLAFGGAEQVKEELREIHYWRWLATLGRDLKYTSRSLRKSPAFTTLAVLIVGLGIGVNLAVFSLIDSLFFQPLAVDRPAELVQISSLDRAGRPAAIVSTVLDSLRLEPALRGVCGHFTSRLPVEVAGTFGSASALSMTGDCFATLGVRTQLGRPFEPVDDRPGAAGVAVLSDAFWRRNLGGNTGAIGQRLQVKGAAFTIIGVADPGFTGFQLGAPFDLIVPLAQTPLDFVPVPNRSVYFWVNIVARRAPGVSERQLQARLGVVEKQLIEGSVPARFTDVQKREYLDRKLVAGSAHPGVNSRLRNRFGQPLFTVMGICACVLLIASVNLTSLLLARGLGRQREMSVRLALGASRASVARLFAWQSTVLVAAGALAGLLFAQWSRHAIVAAAGDYFRIPPELPFDSHAAAFLVSAVLLVAAILAALPAWQSTRFGGGAARSEGGRGVVGASTRKQKVLLGLQVALTLALVAGSSMFTVSAKRLNDMSLGLRTAGVAEAMLAPLAGGYAGQSAGAYHRDLLQRVEALPGVASVALSDFAPFWNGLRPETIAGLETGLAATARAQIVAVSERFFDTLAVPLLAGEGFRRDDAEPVAIVSQSVARLFGNQAPVGQHIRLGDAPGYQRLKVVGIAANVQISLQDPDDSSPLAVYVNLWQHPDRHRYTTLLVKSAAATPVAQAVLRKAVQSFGREYVQNYITLEAARNGALIENQMLAWLSAAFGVLALILAATGLFGLLSYHVASRTSEIGLRMALGAGRPEIHALVLRQVAPVMAAGTLAGLGLALLGGKVVAGLVYGVSVYDLRLLALPIVALFVTAALAAWIPARRASAIDPLVALRHE